jgi:hypothetical protein
VGVFSEVGFKDFLGGEVGVEVFAWHVLVDYVFLGLETCPVKGVGVGLCVAALCAFGGFCFFVKFEFVVCFGAFVAPVSAISPYTIE